MPIVKPVWVARRANGEVAIGRGYTYQGQETLLLTEKQATSVMKKLAKLLGYKLQTQDDLFDDQEEVVDQRPGTHRHMNFTSSLDESTDEEPDHEGHELG